MTEGRQRVFLTQSSSSHSAEVATASRGLRTMPTRTSATTPATRSRTATAAESNQRMATERRRRAEGAKRLARLERASSELATYGRRRFEATTDEMTPPTLVSQVVEVGINTKCGLSPYTTVVMETENTPSPRGPDSAEREVGRMRARLMNELRLRQSEQPIRFRHDRTAQELAQEGCLTARAARTTGGYPWPAAYKYTPFPEPRLQRWVVAQRHLAAEALTAAEEADKVDDSEDDTEAQTVLIELAVQATPQVSPPSTHPHVSLQLPMMTVSQPQQQRKASDSQLPGKFAGLAPSDKKWQRSKSQATVQKHTPHRLLSVSTIGHEERSRRQAQLQRLAQVCAKLNSHRQCGTDGTTEASKTECKQKTDGIDYLVDEIEAAVANGGPLFSAGTETDEAGVPLPALTCPGSLAKSREHLTRNWLREHRFRGIGPSPITG